MLDPHRHNDARWLSRFNLSNIKDEIDNQAAAQIAKEYDPDGICTIGNVYSFVTVLGRSDITLGVLTKADLVPKGDHDVWLDILNNKSHPLKHGYYVTRQPSAKEMSENPSWETTQIIECTFFQSQSPWCELDRNRLGTEALTEALSTRLSHMIQHR